MTASRSMWAVMWLQVRLILSTSSLWCLCVWFRTFRMRLNPVWSLSCGEILESQCPVYALNIRSLSTGLSRIWASFGTYNAGMPAACRPAMSPSEGWSGQPKVSFWKTSAPLFHGPNAVVKWVVKYVVISNRKGSSKVSSKLPCPVRKWWCHPQGPRPSPPCAIYAANKEKRIKRGKKKQECWGEGKKLQNRPILREKQK